MQKKCLSCGAQFVLSGSGKRQKYCPECSRRGDGSCGIQFTLSGSGKRQKYCSNCSSREVHQGRGLPASNALKTKAAKHASVRQQVEAQKHLPNPISFTAPEGHRGRVWLASDRNGKKLIGDDRHWRVHVSEAIKRAEAKKRKASIFNKPERPNEWQAARQRRP